MFNLNTQSQTELRQKITQHYRLDEKECVHNLLQNIKLNETDNQKAMQLATDLISRIRITKVKGVGVDSLMRQFKLSTTEGIALMCLAESLLRIPDKETQDKLIRDKVSNCNWANYTKTENLFVNAVSWGLLITGKMADSYDSEKLADSLLKIMAKGGEPLIRKAMTTAVKFLGNQFVMGETIEDALKDAVEKEKIGYQFSYDMLGEAALTDSDAMRYFDSYVDAIHAVGCANNNRGVINGPGISVKLSALHPRYQKGKHSRVIKELYPRLKHLYLLAKHYQIAIFIDAEETERLDVSLDLLEKLASDKDLAGFLGIGFVVQAYQKRAYYVIDYIANLASKYNQKIMVRLVKGAYWDSEIKKAQVDGQSDYPVFTRKFYTDLSYIACSEKILNYQEQIYPLFATHNAYTLALIYVMAKDKKYELQGLYGMCESLYDNVIGENNLNLTCRVYAPVGSHETLLAYLVRRLLENGANSSFVHQIVDKKVPIEKLVACPIELSRNANGEPNPYFAKPEAIFSDGRMNSRGLDLTDDNLLLELGNSLAKIKDKKYEAYPLLASFELNSGREIHTVTNPARLSDIVGDVVYADLNDVDQAVAMALSASLTWSEVTPQKRASYLLKVADLMEQNYYELINILVREAGKTFQNAINEVREAVDFCRYYAFQAINELDNENYKPLGVMVCISPWNFPLAIFMGEISSAIAAGNTVIAKPSEQTNLVAFYAVNLFHQAGLPKGVLQFMPGLGRIIGDALTKHKDVKGVIFTGSTETAQLINRNLSSISSEYVLIAETGGQNAMIVDSSALPEQVVADVVNSGFDSAGQRCSALRVLYLQADIADNVLEMLKGAMDELRVGDPANIETDVGPVIDERAKNTLLAHIDNMKPNARMFYQSRMEKECMDGIFVPPTLIEIGSINELNREVFGPVIHVIRFTADKLDDVINEINSSGYGLTQGLHSRINSTAKKIYEKIKAGNIYINRNMVGAVVGVQPFGGEGLSGTGPKAGGPLYLHRLVKTLSHHEVGEELKEPNFSSVEAFINNLKEYGFNDKDKADLANYAAIMKQRSPLTRQINLPGPTGEKNFMFFASRGHILCAAGSKFDYAKQIICALTTDNIAVLPMDAHSKAFTVLLSESIKISDNATDDKDIKAALIANSYPNPSGLCKELANREGCLIINVHEKLDGTYNLHLLTIERTVSNNITATGGNVELMSINDMIEKGNVAVA